MKKFVLFLLVILSCVAFSSCSTKIEEVDYDVVGYWKFTGFNGEVYPDDYYSLEITSNKIMVYDRYKSLVETFSYTRKKNTMTLSAPFAGKYTSILIDSASYNEAARLGQMLWDCGGGQKYYFGFWDRN